LYVNSCHKLSNSEDAFSGISFIYTVKNYHEVKERHRYECSYIKSVFVQTVVFVTQANADNTVHFTMFSVITNIYNKKTKGPTLMEL